MWPKAKKWGWKYLWNLEFRDRCRKKEAHRRGNKKYGNYQKNAPSIRTALFGRDGNKCCWCDEPMKYKDATIDQSRL